MARYTYSDIVTVKADAPADFRPGERAWVIAVLERPDEHIPGFPPGAAYTVEFENGDAIDLPEIYLE